MDNRRFTRGASRTAVILPALALAVAGLAATGVSGGATAAPSTPTKASAQPDESYINYVAPRAEKSSENDVTVDRKTGKAQQKQGDALSQAYAIDKKNARGAT